MQPSQTIVGGDSQPMWQDLHDYKIKSYHSWENSGSLDVGFEVFITTLKQNSWSSITPKLA